MTDKLYLRPDVSGYGMTPPEEVIYTALKGGEGHFVSDGIDGSSIVNVQWTCDQGKHDYLWAFYRLKTERGPKDFLIDLILEGPTFVERTVHFIPGSLCTSGIEGLKFVNVAQLETESIVADDDVDTAIADGYEAWGDDPMGYLALLRQIVETWPEA